MFCQPEEIEQLSMGNVLRCLDERNAPPAARADAPAPPPAQLLCVSFDHSGWSNNAAMFTRHWWLRVLTSGSSLTTDGNGMFEVRRRRWCGCICCAGGRCQRAAPQCSRTNGAWRRRRHGRNPTSRPHLTPYPQINAMYAPCRAQSRVSNLTGITPGARPPFVCQLWPGMFVHEEIDG